MGIQTGMIHAMLQNFDLVLSCAMGTSEVEPSWHREEIESSLEELHDADWSDLTESQLEELVLSNLDTIFKNATKKIIASGYIEEVAIEAILRPGLCHVRKDLVSNIVDNTLAFLRSAQDVDLSKDHYFGEVNISRLGLSSKRGYAPFTVLWIQCGAC